MREASNKIKWIAEARSLEGGRLCCEGTLERKGETPRIYKNQRLRFSGFLALSFSTCGARLQLGKPAIPSYCIFQPSFGAVFPLWLLLLWLAALVGPHSCCTTDGLLLRAEAEE
ncbi:unnamed protein product [Lepidochelys kempii]